MFVRANPWPAFAFLILGGLFVAVGCVDLAAPKVLFSGSGGQGGTPPATTASAPSSGGVGAGGATPDNAGGAGGTAAGGAGGAGTSAGATTDDGGGVPAGGAGGATPDNAGGATADGEGGVTTDDGGARTGGADGSAVTDSAGGARTGGAGGTGAGGAKTGGAGGTRTGGTGGKASGGTSGGASGGKTPDAAVLADLRPGNEVAALLETAPPPDAAIDAPVVPDVQPDAQPNPDGPAGLVLYYTCEQASAATLPDMSGNGRNGTLKGATSFVPGQVGNALLLTATNTPDAATGGSVEMPVGNLGSFSEISIVTWFKITSAQAYQRIFDLGTSSTTSSMFLTTQYTTGNLHFTMRRTLADGTNIIRDDIDGTVIPTDTWEHVAVVIDASRNARMYLNGAQVGPTTAMKLRLSDLGAAPNDWIGRSEFVSDPYFNGAIDEFRIYNRALDAAEIQALYSAP